MGAVNGAALPVMVTRKMRADLNALGYGDLAIDKMTPQEAWEKLGNMPPTIDPPNVGAPPIVKTKSDAITLARFFMGAPIDPDALPSPLGDVVRRALHGASNRVIAFQEAAEDLQFADAQGWIDRALAIDPNATPENERPLDLLSADAILQTEWAEPVWAIPNLLPVGLAILAGAPKLGKSWLGLQIAFSIASGGIALGERVEAGPVLYLALEDPARRLKDRMTKQGWTRGLPAEFMPIGKFADEIKDLTNGGGERLARQIETRGYRLVVIDTLSRAIPSGKDQRDVGDMTTALTPLQEIAHAHSCAVLMIDHHRKIGNGGGGAPDAIADILGSTAKGAMTDTAWGLYRERGKAGARLVITGREVEEKNLALKMDWTRGYWNVEGDADALEITARRQEILNALKTLGAARLRDIAEAIDQNRGNTYQRLQDLTNAGLVAVKNGIYTLSQTTHT